MFNAVRCMLRAGFPWRMLPNDLLLWPPVQLQVRRWGAAGCLEELSQDLRKVLRMLAQRHAQPSAVILNRRTLQSTPESGARWLRWLQAQEGIQGTCGGR